MAFDTFTFSNFKSFGPKPQTINRKPLTLVYGPNSVGKSSLLHAMMLAGYQANNIQPIHKSSHFAGDVLNLGEGNNFIHKKAKYTSCTLTYRYKSDRFLDHFRGSGYPIAKSLKDNGFNIADFTFEKYITFIKNINLMGYVLPNRIVLSMAIANPNDLNLERHIKYNKKYFNPMFKKCGVISSKEKLASLIDEISNKANKNYDIENISLKSLISMFDLELYKNEVDQDFLSSQEYVFLRDAYQLFGKDVFKDKFECFSYNASIKRALNNKGFIKLLYDIDIKNHTLSNNVDCISSSFNELERALIHVIEYYTYHEVNALIKWARVYTSSDESSEQFLDYERILKKHYDETYVELEKLITTPFCSSFELESKFSYGNNLKVCKSSKIERSSIDDGAGELQSNNYFIDMVDKVSLEEHFKFLSVIFSDVNSNIESVYPYLQNSFSGVNYTLKCESSIQYFSPLRLLPTRLDLQLKRVKANKREGKPLRNSTISDFTNSLAVRLYLAYVRSELSERMIQKLPKIFVGIFIKKGKFNYLPRIFAALFSLPYIIPRLFKTDQRFVDVINEFKGQKYKKRLGRAENSLQLWHSLITDPSHLESVNDWLRDERKINNRYQIVVLDGGQKLKQLAFKDMQNGTLVYPQDMGLGISQILPIILASKIHREHKIYIEQPELHLHPAMQCEIADDFIQSVNERDNEFIIESHSEHMLLRIMRRMRETANGDLAPDSPLALTPSDVCLLYVDNNGEHTYVNELELDEDGTLLDPWPNGFFEEGYKERFA
ncbi:AAA family ATPase [Vibrio sp. MMG022]|uniref:AAA family ATPase n=1 Tax=Vibrio sp. MMG023 TaxID=2909979 RepID=UPI001F0178FC|nr:AAA family ATPase [Vibrio sp. MMG023]MCF6453529.1 AAA family ATPase [Vibrio sp. MMG023]